MTATATGCTDGQGHATKHAAEGWIVSPDGTRHVRMCLGCANEVITEYATKMGWTWTFEAFA